MRRLSPLACTVLSLPLIWASGCRPQQPYYLFERGDLSHYEGEATRIEYPDADVDSLDEVSVDGQNNRPFTLQHTEVQRYWDLSLENAVQASLANSKVMRSIGGQVLTAPETLTRTADLAATVFDPALAETDPRFGPEAALSAFDAQLKGSLFWSRGDRPQNLATNDITRQFLRTVNVNDSSTFSAEISKTNATGGTTALREHTNYQWSNSPTRLWPSDWYVDIEAEYRQPLLQGAGVQFNRIAGPGAQPGQYNGVVLARINTDIRLADFEASVRNLVMDVERAYWELAMAYHLLETAKQGRDATLETWRIQKTKFEVGAGDVDASAESQAREQYFQFHALVQQALNNLYTVENNLRYVMGISATDGELIRPIDQPTTAKITFPWEEIHREGLVRSVELRRQRWKIKQREMELIASKNFLLPRLDAVGTYRWLGLGDDLASTKRYDPNNVTAFQSLTGGKFQEWQFGLQLDVPIGFRREMAGVRNAQLALSRERAVLQDEELEISHQIAQAVRNLEGAYELMQTGFSRLQAAKFNVEKVGDRVAAGTQRTATGADVLFVYLDALRRLAESKSNFYQAVTTYNESIALVHYRKGSLLEYNGVYLAEGPWPAKAYFDATRMARERDAAIYMDYGFTRPRVMSRGEYEQHQGTIQDPGYQPPDVKPGTTGIQLEQVPTPAPEPMSAVPATGGQAAWSPAMPSKAATPAAAPGIAFASGQAAGGPAAEAPAGSRIDRDVRPVSFHEPVPSAPGGWNLRSMSPPVGAPNEPRTSLPPDQADRSAAGWKTLQR